MNRAGNIYRRGDKEMQIRNNYYEKYEPLRYAPKQSHLHRHHASQEDMRPHWLSKSSQHRGQETNRLQPQYQPQRTTEKNHSHHMKLLKYSLALAGLFFISAIIPGIICVLCGFNGVWASSGISLAIVCLLKGKIAKKIFGPNTTLQSSPNAAFFLIAISLISGGIKAYTYYLNKTTMENLGFTYESTREQVFSQLFVPLLIASLFWALVLGVVTYIRGRQKKHHVEDVVPKSDPVSSSLSQPIINSDVHEEALKPNIVIKEGPLHNDKTSNTPKNHIKNVDNHKSNRAIINTISNYKKYLWVIFGIIAVIAIVIFGISKFNNSRNSIGEYLYADSFGNIHSDIDCELLNTISPTRIKYTEFTPSKSYDFCKKCFTDEMYQKVFEDRHLNIRIAEAYDNFASKFSENKYSMMFSDLGTCQKYVKNGDIHDLHRLYTINVIRPNNKEFNSFKDFLSYFEREDLVEELPNLYNNISKADKKKYIYIYREFIDYYTNYQYDMLTLEEFISDTQSNQACRDWMYHIGEEYMKVDSYEDFAKTIVF